MSAFAVVKEWEYVDMTIYSADGLKRNGELVSQNQRTAFRRAVTVARAVTFTKFLRLCALQCPNSRTSDSWIFGSFRDSASHI